MILNTQKPEGIRAGAFDTVDLHSRWNTIQGEGPFAGTPASFIRLAGCNLQCQFCDTLYTDGRKSIKVSDLALWAYTQKPKLVVITGGEPFRQGLGDLVRHLLEFQKIVQIETNGTLYNEISSKAYVVCSPKTPKIHNHMAMVVSAWKYVVNHDAIDPVDGLPTSALGMEKPPARPTNNREVFIQPCDSKDESTNRRNLEAAIESCERFGYRLCIQIQKLIGKA